MMNPNPETFEQYRPLLFSIAYRMLGTAMEAEDMVQETFLRYHATPPEDIRNMKAFLTTIVTRLSLNQLNSARAKREEYMGPWLPEPIRTDSSSRFGQPVEAVDMHESISMAFLVLLESLSPPERAVFLLREVFEHSYSEIADILDKSEENCRQLFSRARKHIRAKRPRFATSAEKHQQLLQQFMTLAGTGSPEKLMTMLVEDVTMWTDGGGQATAATRTLIGRENVAKFVIGTTRFLPEHYSVELGEVNGEIAALFRNATKVFLVMFIEVQDEKICGVRVIANPEKLGRL